jgi:spore coat polysaccharide biosynthesis predicted glycosyltransferase SpsG
MKINELTIIQFVGHYNNFAKRILAKAKLKYAASLSKVNIQDYKVILDSYDVSQTYIDNLIRSSWRFIKIDDFNEFNLSNADMVINIRFGAEKMLYHSKNKCLGIKYFPAHPKLNKVREKKLSELKNLPDLSQMKNILIFIGGTDKFNITKLLLTHLNTMFKNKYFFLFCDPRGQISLNNLKNNFELHTITDEIFDYFEIADILISGGGITKYEAAFSCIPNACVSQTEYQAEDTKLVAAANLTFDLGLAKQNTLMPDKFYKSLSLFFSPAEIDRQRTEMVKYFDTSSSARLANEIYRL